MFINLLFLVFVLMLTSIAPDIKGEAYLDSPQLAFTESLGLYAIILSCIALFAYFFRKYRGYYSSWFLHFINGLLIAYLCLFHFYFIAHLFYKNLPIVSESQAFLTLMSLLFYFIGLAVYHYCSYRKDTAAMLYRHSGRFNYAFVQLRFLVPFSFPFLIFSCVTDLALFTPEAYRSYFGFSSESAFEVFALFAVSSLLFLSCMILFFPALLQYAWGCELLEESELKERLDRLCKKANFTHSGLTTWSVMNHVVTAAVMGVIPKFRYVMFTKRLLYSFEPQQIEAILAHEIGHSQRKHLLFYPFIALGILVILSAFSCIFGEGIDHYFSLYQLSYPDAIQIYPFILFIMLALLILIYFRLVYGFYSRLFERQADLHVLELDVPGEYMLQALDRVGILNENNHEESCWHHYGIRQRMNFLQEAMKNPKLIQNHHWKVCLAKLGFFTLLVSLFFISLMDFYYPKLPVIKELVGAVEWVSENFKENISLNQRSEISKKYIQQYELKGDQEKIKHSIQKSLSLYGGDSIRGLAEFYAAQMLFKSKELKASTRLMIQAWEQFDFALVDEKAKEDFKQTSYQIIEERWLSSDRKDSDVLQLLEILKMHSEERKELKF